MCIVIRTSNHLILCMHAGSTCTSTWIWIWIWRNLTGIYHVQEVNISRQYTWNSNIFENSKTLAANGTKREHGTKWSYLCVHWNTALYWCVCVHGSLLLKEKRNLKGAMTSYLQSHYYPQDLQLGIDSQKIKKALTYSHKNNLDATCSPSTAIIPPALLRRPIQTIWRRQLQSASDRSRTATLVGHWNGAVRAPLQKVGVTL